MRNEYEEAMAGVLARIAQDGRGEALFGDALDRTLDAYHCFSTPTEKPFALLEFPLLGTPGFDVGIGFNQGPIQPGARLYDQSQTVAQAAVDWIAAWPKEPRPNLFFKLDESGGPDQKPGIHCKLRRQPGAADAFFEVIGEAWRAPLYREVEQRLPPGWFTLFAAVFPSRSGKKTRFEVALFDDALEDLKSGPSFVRDLFDAIGFPHYDESMLDQIVSLAGESRAIGAQFDIEEDGSFCDVFSLISYLEGTGADFHALFEPDGHVSRVCRLYEELGAADDRWRRIEGALFAERYFEILEGMPTIVTGLALPCCAKAKWRAASLVPAKFYLMARAIL